MILQILDNLDFGKLKNVPADLKNLSDVVSKEVVKNATFDKLNTKVNSLENKIPAATTLIYINQYNTDKQSLEKKVREKCLTLLVSNNCYVEYEN